MEISINKKSYPLHFGWGFLSYINHNHGIIMEGVNSHVGGMALLNAGAAMKDPEILLSILAAGTSTEQTPPTKRELQEYIEGLIENGEYVKVFDEALEEMGKSLLLQQALNMNKVIEKVTKKK